MKGKHRGWRRVRITEDRGGRVHGGWSKGRSKNKVCGRKVAEDRG